MSQSTQYGLTKLIPGDDFRLAVDNEGKVTASQSYRIGKNGADFALQTLLRKGVPASVLNPALGTDFDFLFADSIDRQDGAGGITVFNVTFSGKSWFAEYADDSESTYSLASTMVERPITEHPKLRLELDITEQTSLVMLIEGKAKCINPTSAGPYYVVGTDLGETRLQDLETTNGKKWFKKIFQQGKKTYSAPTLEWTWSSTNEGGLPQTTMNKLGFIDDSPRGNPPTPIGRNWLMSGATDSRTRGGESATSSFSITWLLSDPNTEWDEDIYTPYTAP